MSLRGLPSDIEPASVAVRTLTPNAELGLVDIRFYNGLVTPQALLSQYLGKEVVAYVWDDGLQAERGRPAVLLGVSADGPVVALDNQVRALEFGRVAVPKLPDGLRAEPTLELLVTSDRDVQEVELTYTTQLVDAGMEYHLVRAPGSNTAQLAGLLGVVNKSGTPLVDATIAVASDAGEPNEFAASDPSGDRSAAPREEEAPGAASSTTLVRLPTPLTLAGGERAILRLFGPVEAALTRKLVVEGPGFPISQSDEYPNASIRTVLDALPAQSAPLSPHGLIGGRAHLFERIGEGPARAYGTAAARPLPGAKGIRVDLGPESRYPSRRRLVGKRSLGRCVVETSWDVTVSNPTEAPLVLEDAEPVTGKYEVLDSNVPPIAKEVDHFAFGITVPAKEESHLKFRVRTMGCVPARSHYWQPRWGKSWSKEKA